MNFLYSLLFLSVCAKGLGTESSSKEQELLKITQSILALEEEKSRYEKKRIRHLDQGRQWQFNKDNSLESKREYFLAEKDRDKVLLIELKIQNLLVEKKELLED